MRILMARPSLSDAELHAVKTVFDSGWLGEGKLTYEFEEKLCEFTGAAHAVAVNTGTSALHLSLVSRGIGPGDEVILPILHVCQRCYGCASLQSDSDICRYRSNNPKP